MNIGSDIKKLPFKNSSKEKKIVQIVWDDDIDFAASYKECCFPHIRNPLNGPCLHPGPVRSTNRGRIDPAF